MTPGKCRYDITLRPISGKAIPLYAGEVMRIIQVEGEQCVDFNCFNLRDYKERMSVGHMRLQGFRVGAGPYRGERAAALSSDAGHHSYGADLRHGSAWRALRCHGR